MRRVAWAGILVDLVLLIRLLPVERLVGALTDGVEGMGLWGPVVFAGAYVAAALLFVPGSALTLAAGAVFGLAVGTVTVWLAATAAAALAFLVGRHVARDAVARRAAASPRFGAMDRAIGAGGWRVVALLRLSPAVPFSVGNYLFGLTPVAFVPYVLASWLAMLPGTLMYVYLGHAGRAGLAEAGGGSGRDPLEWGLLAVGLAATVLVTVYVTRLARRALQAQGGLVASQPVSDPSPRRTAGRPWPGTRLLVAVLLLLSAITTYAYLQAR